MYSGYNLKINEDSYIFSDDNFEYFKEIGEQHLGNQMDEFQSKIQECVMREKMDGSEIQNNYFPQIDADIFISHSNVDQDLALALAGWLNRKFGLKCFVDAAEWNYAETLRRELNDMVSNKREDDDGGWLYDHQSCNEVSQHVDIMLAIALYQMIDRVESVFLLNTEHAVQEVHDGNRMDETYSPWIYLEMICTQLVRKKPRCEYRDDETDILRHSLSESMESARRLSIPYEVPLEHLTSINSNDLNEWYDEYKQNKRKYGEYALDALYCIKPPKSEGGEIQCLHD